jgi:hypothetical protein
MPYLNKETMWVADNWYCSVSFLHDLNKVTLDIYTYIHTYIHIRMCVCMCTYIYVHACMYIASSIF